MASQNPIPTYFNPEIGPQYRGLSFEDVANSFNNGQQFSNQIQQQQQQGLLSRLLAQSTGQDGQVDLNKALEVVQSNPNQSYQPALINSLSGLIQQQNAARLKAQQDALKSDAEINKTYAETGKIKQEGLNKGLENSGIKSGALNDIFRSAAISGSKNNVLLGLNGAFKSGLIDADTFEQQKNIVNLMTPEEIKEFATGLGFNNKETAPYLFQTKNNAADNATSTNNNIRSTNASIYSTDVGAQTAAAKLAQDKILADQERAFKNGEIKEIMTGTDGKAYAVYRDGRVEPSMLPGGNQFTPQSKSNNGQPRLSDKALNSVNEMNVQLSTATQNSQKINGLIGDIQSGRLNLGAANQLGAKTKNFLGMSDENSRGVENFQTALNQAVNDVLMMAKGTQTEGDAQRAATVIAANPPRDNAAAVQALQRLAAVQKNTISVLNGNINGIYENYGVLRPQNSTAKPSSGSDQSRLDSILFGR